MIDKEFILGGKAIFTLEVPEYYRKRPDIKEFGLKPHYTFKVEYSPPNRKYKENYFVKLFTGTENTNCKHYKYAGLLENGKLRLTVRSVFDQRRPADKLIVSIFNRALELIWNNNPEPMLTAGFDIHHEGFCCRCARLLTTVESIKRGYGPECWKMTHGGNYPNLGVKAMWDETK